MAGQYTVEKETIGEAGNENCVSATANNIQTHKKRANKRKGPY